MRCIRLSKFLYVTEVGKNVGGDLLIYCKVSRQRRGSIERAMHALLLSERLCCPYGAIT